MTEPTSGPMTTEGVNRIEHVDSPTVFGDCSHDQAAKLLVGQGELRTPTTKMVEVEPGVNVEVTYYQPDAEVTYVATVICAECGNQQVQNISQPLDDTTGSPLPPPPLNVNANSQGATP